MSQSRLRCPNCPERHFSTLVEAVQHVMSERGPSKQVQCCVEKCPYKVRRLRQHIRKIHKEFCLWPCSACHASFVGRKDLKNHCKDCQKLACVTSVSLGLKSKDIQDIIGKHDSESFRLQVDSPTSNYNSFAYRPKLFRLHDLSRFVYTWFDIYFAKIDEYHCPQGAEESYLTVFLVKFAVKL